MHEILRHLTPEARLLDLGSGAGSFAPGDTLFATVRVDAELPSGPRPSNFIRADAASLPFRSGVFEAVVSNHSLEHFENLNGALSEIARVIKPTGALYVAVPDATTITDILYRWLARGGGHVNAFSSAEALAGTIEAVTGLPHRGTRPLCTSLSFMNSRNLTTRAPRRLLLFAGGNEAVLLLMTGLFRLCDRLLGTRLSLYGWALYFGYPGEPIAVAPWTNVCIRCGAGHSSGWLLTSGRVEPRWVCFSSYSCSQCGTRNLFTRDEAYKTLR